MNQELNLDKEEYSFWFESEEGTIYCPDCNKSWFCHAMAWVGMRSYKCNACLNRNLFWESNENTK